MAFAVPVLRKNYILYPGQQPKQNYLKNRNHSEIVPLSNSLPSILTYAKPTTKVVRNKSVCETKTVKPIKQTFSAPIKSVIVSTNNTECTSKNKSLQTKCEKELKINDQINSFVDIKALFGTTERSSSKTSKQFMETSIENLNINEKKCINTPGCTSLCSSSETSNNKSSDPLTLPDSGYTSSCTPSPLSGSPNSISAISRSVPPSPEHMSEFTFRTNPFYKGSKRISIRRLDSNDEDEAHEPISPPISPLTRHVHFGFCEQIEYDETEENQTIKDEKTEKIKEKSRLKRLENKLASQLKSTTILRPRALSNPATFSTHQKVKESATFDEFGRALSAENLHIKSDDSISDSKTKRNFFRWASFRASKHK